MKVKGPNIPSSLENEMSMSVQLPTRSQASYSNLYGDEQYGSCGYGTNLYVKLRFPYRLPHMQGGKNRP